MPQNAMTTRWRGKPVRPPSYDDQAALVKLARKVRGRIVEFDWEVSLEELNRLREAAHFWGSMVQGRYKKFDAQVVAAINEVLDEPDSPHRLDAPGGAESIDSRVEAARTGDRYRLSGHASFDVVFGYGRASQESRYRVRLGEDLADKLQQTVQGLGWDVNRLSEPQLRPVLNALYGLRVNYGIEAEASRTVPSPTETMELRFRGPFHWSRTQGLPWLFGDSISRRCGIYLWTLPVEEEQRVHYVGQTGRSFAGRLSEHLAAYLSGQYSILDAQELARGNQKLVWRAASGGSGYGATLTDFVSRSEELVPKITELLNLFRFHVAPVEGNARLRERIEGTLGRHFQDHDVAGDERFFGTEARFPAAIPYEKTLRCRFTAEGRIAGLPDELIV